MKSVWVIATSHALQGADNARGRRVDDPSYREMVKAFLINNQIDFVFEEASGCGPTDARRIAESRTPTLHYLDIDPHPNEREKHGLARETGSGFPCIPINPDRPKGGAYWEEYIDPQMQRERFWLQRIKEQDFTRGLFICGYLHLFSFAAKLQSEGWVVNSFCYMPHHKLCIHEEET